jgi:hypothetical protein
MRAVAPSLVLAGAVAWAAIAPATAAAAEEPTEAEYPNVKMTPAQVQKMTPAQTIKMMDPDNKGYVTKEEFLKFQEQLWKNIQKSDPNKVTDQEWLHQIHTGP